MAEETEQYKLQLLIEELSMDICEIIFRSSPEKIQSWANGSTPIPTSRSKTLQAAYAVLGIISSIPKDEYRLWMVRFSPYLYGIPAEELARNPSDVVTAALHLSLSGDKEEVF